MRKLPLLIERSLATVQETRSRLGSAFYQEIAARTDISCKKGCHHCCYHPVLISLLEGVLLYRALHGKGLWTPALVQEIERVSGLTTGLPAETWMVAEIACPLLKDGHCSVYDQRPLVCRTTYSTGLPEHCHPHQFGRQTKLVHRLDVLVRFQDAEREVFRNLDLRLFTAPLALALKLGERISTGTLEPEHIQQTLYEEYAR